MSETIQGVVQGVSPKEWSGKTFYSLKIDNVFYGCGMKKPKVAAGNTVSFQAEKNDKGYWSVQGDIQVIDATISSSPAPFTPTNSRSSDQQSSIEYQACLKAAAPLAVVIANKGNLNVQDVKQVTKELTNYFFNLVKTLGKSEDEKIPIATSGFAQTVSTKSKPTTKKKEVEQPQEEFDDELPPY